MLMVYRKDDIVLVVTGVTGSGKSTFIEKCCDQDVNIGHGLDSCAYSIPIFETSC